MNDRKIFQQINQLIAEEHELRDKGGLNESERVRLQSLEVALDQCWDLLRQRRGKRHAGQDPDEAEVRPAGTVEKYEQ